jgi:curli biogenesis system outer membrane secretion channel CsgG/SH3-like domain-containing protein
MGSRAVPSILAASAMLLLSAGGAAAQDKPKDAIEKCEAPLGTLSINEPAASVVTALSSYNLGSPAALLRIMIQESNCFQVVERGSGLQQMKQERALASGGDLQQGSNVGGGQMAAADFLMTPGVIFSDMNSGGIGGALGGIAGRKLGIGGGGVKFKDASTSLLISNVRTGVQVAAAEGKARKTDFGWGALAVLGLGAGAGGYSSTDEGKIIAASFRDNYNKVVLSVRANKNLTAAAPKAGAVYNEGELLSPKIDGVRLMTQPADNAASTATLRTSDTLVFLGEIKDGFLKVQRPNGAGWVRETLIAKGAGKGEASGLASLAEGDVLKAKIDGVQIVRAPKEGAASLATLKRDETVVYLGLEEGGFLKVLATAGEGWVRKLVVSPAK